MFPHCTIHEYTWTSPDGNTCSQIDHILIDRRRHSSVLDVQSFRAGDCNTDHYLVVVKVRERLAVNKQRTRKFHMESFNLSKLNKVEGKEQFRVEVSNRFAALQDLDTEVEINSAWKTIRENIKISAKGCVGYFELKKHKPWFNKECAILLDERKRAKFQWLQDPSEVNRNNMSNVSREPSRYFRNKEREYLKDKINEIAMNSKNKNIRDLYKGIKEFKMGYQMRNNLVKDENGDLLAESHNILNKWKNYFSQL
jgi:hypothetical protein